MPTFNTSADAEGISEFWYEILLLRGVSISRSGFIAWLTRAQDEMCKTAFTYLQEAVRNSMHY